MLHLFCFFQGVRHLRLGLVKIRDNNLVSKDLSNLFKRLALGLREEQVDNDGPHKVGADEERIVLVANLLEGNRGDLVEHDIDEDIGYDGNCRAL